MPGVKVKEGESFENVLKRFKKQCEKAGILSEIRKREHYEKPSVKKKKKALADAEVIETISTLVKQRRESIRLFREGQRQDLVEKEEAELQFLQAYLPQPLSQSAIEVLIDQVLLETHATGMKDQGKVMKAVMAKISGRAEGKIVSEIVKQKLSKLAS